MTKEFEIKGYIKVDSYDDSLNIYDKKEESSYSEELGDKFESILKSLDIPSWNISYSDWTQGNYYFIDSIFIRYFISDKEQSWEELNEEHIKTLAGVMRLEEHFDGYSEYTIMSSWHDIFVGKHNLIEELKSYEGKYLVLRVSIKTNEQPN